MQHKIFEVRSQNTLIKGKKPNGCGQTPAQYMATLSTLLETGTAEDMIKELQPVVGQSALTLSTPLTEEDAVKVKENGIIARILYMCVQFFQSSCVIV